MLKKITSLTLGISFLIMTYTGIMLFIAPHGRVAYWSNWHFLGLTKNQYGDLHTTSMILFMLSAVLHIYYNWKPLMSYLKNSAREITFTKKEFLIAFLINFIFVVGTLFMLQPFKVYLEFEESIKDSWIKDYGEPPYGHAEETKLSTFCRKMNIDLKKAKQALNEHNIIFKENQSLKTIAKNNHTTPNDIYKIIQGFTINSSTMPIKRGFGRKSLKELCKEEGWRIDQAMKILKQNGAIEPSKDSRIKNIADDMGVTPFDIYNLLKKNLNNQ